MNTHVHPIFANILNDWAASFSKAPLRPYVVHTFRHGQVIKQRMPDYTEARLELAAIARNSRRGKLYVTKVGRELFCVEAPSVPWSKTVSIQWL